MIDDVVTGNAYTSDEELESPGELNSYFYELNIRLEDRITDIERKYFFRKIILEEMI